MLQRVRPRHADGPHDRGGSATASTAVARFRGSYAPDGLPREDDDRVAAARRPTAATVASGSSPATSPWRERRRGPRRRSSGRGRRPPPPARSPSGGGCAALPARDRVALVMATRNGWVYDDGQAALLDQASVALGRRPHEAPAAVTAALDRRLGALPPEPGLVPDGRADPGIRPRPPRSRRSSCSPPPRPAFAGASPPSRLPAEPPPVQLLPRPLARPIANYEDLAVVPGRQWDLPERGDAGQRPHGRADRAGGGDLCAHECHLRRSVDRPLVRRCGPCRASARARSPVGSGRLRAGRRRPDRARPCTPSLPGRRRRSA